MKALLLVGDAAPAPKDTVIAALAAAAGVAGLVLVLLGLIASAIQAYPTETPSSVLAPYKHSGVAALVTFLLSIATVAVGLAWLVVGGGTSLYHAVIALFSLQLAALIVLACVVYAKVVR